MRDYLSLKQILWAHMAILWSASAWAAQDTLPHDLTSIPLGAVAVAMALAFVGGLASTTQKIAKPDTSVPNVPFEIFKDIINSLAAGLVAFFVGAGYGWPPFNQAVFITVAGYGGSRFLEPALVALIDRAKLMISGSPTVPPTPPGDAK